MALDARGQVLLGVSTLLRSRLGDALAAGTLRTAFPDADLLAQIGGGPGQLPYLVALLLGDERPAPDNATRRDSPYYLVTPAGPDALTTRLIEDMRVQAPLSLILVTSGDTGQRERGRLTDQLIGALGQTVTVPLPDGVPDTAGESPTSTYGLTAQLIYATTRADDRMGGRKLWRMDVTYTARYARYHAEETTLVSRVRTTTLLGTGGLAATE